ncbi:MAG: acylphosphatase [Candidatus Sungbacteria bacterium]|nr:acylphosphatase [Candidatus Sungbacteria bacterium]
MKRAIIRIEGRVQGVFFRHSARICAEKLGITGQAGNEDDSSVTITAEGEEAALAELVEWCKKGPPLASVEKIDTEWQEATGEFKGFEII